MKKLFIGYLTAGHSSLEFTREAAIALAQGGVDIIEIGVPYSDPLADGPVIQQAMQEALSQGVTLTNTCAMIRELTQSIATPIVLFTYLNPVLAFGIEPTIKLAKSVGVKSVLIVDLPLEENSELVTTARKYGLDLIGLISPTTSSERIKQISQVSSGFLYYVCRNGITGVRNNLPEDFPTKIREIQKNSKLPVVAGFGIGDRAQAACALEYADGFVVGSAFINAIQNGASPHTLTQLACNIDPRGESL